MATKTEGTPTTISTADLKGLAGTTPFQELDEDQPDDGTGGDVSGDGDGGDGHDGSPALIDPGVLYTPDDQYESKDPNAPNQSFDPNDPNSPTYVPPTTEGPMSTEPDHSEPPPPESPFGPWASGTGDGQVGPNEGPAVSGMTDEEAADEADRAGELEQDQDDMAGHEVHTEHYGDWGRGTHPEAAHSGHGPHTHQEPGEMEQTESNKDMVEKPLP
jgi:hypothetical protein